MRAQLKYYKHVLNILNKGSAGFYAVDRKVGQVRQESPDLLHPIDATAALELQSQDAKPTQGDLF